MIPAEEFGIRANKVISLINTFIDESSIVESIIETYREFCSSSNAQRLHIHEIPITDDTRLILHFEALCLTTFFAVLGTPKYFMEKKWFKKKANPKLVGLFHGALATALIDYCNDTGICNLREMTIISIDPNPEFGLGNNFDPINRLEEYRESSIKAQGSEIERFGKWIGKALDASHYPILEIIGANFGVPLLNLSHNAMQNVMVHH